MFLFASRQTSFYAQQLIGGKLLKNNQLLIKPIGKISANCGSGLLKI